MLSMIFAFLSPSAGSLAPQIDVVVCSRTMSFEDQYCDAVFIKSRSWSHADAAAAHEAAARYAFPSKAAASYLAAANNWIAAGQASKAVIAFDRALAAGLNGEERRNAFTARLRLVESIGQQDD